MAVKLLGISGSLRAASYNTALLEAARAVLAQTGVELEIARIDDLPLYNSDLGDVAAAERLKQQIAACDGLLIATPEYNYGIPGPLKNAIDWASRPAYHSAFRGKPVGLMGATGSLVGTARAQAHLKQVMLGMLAHPFPWAELLVSKASTRFVGGELVDEETRALLGQYLEAFVLFVERMR